MILQNGKQFFLVTKHTSYLFQVLPSGHLEHLFYGKNILGNLTDPEQTPFAEIASALHEKCEFPGGNLIQYSKDFPTTVLEDLSLEFSSYGKGDIREPFLELTHDDGVTTCDFLFDSAVCDRPDPDPFAPSSLPHSYGASDRLTVNLKEKAYPDLTLSLVYLVYEDCDVITRFSRLSRAGQESRALIQHPVTIQKFMSAQLDFPRSGLTLTTFSGHWGREMHMHATQVSAGRFVNESVCGLSSDRANPFVMLENEDTSETSGDCLGINLIYSGNHYESLSVSGYEKSRFVTGINPDRFSWALMPGQSFETPEAVFAFSDEGRGSMSRRMHDFVREHIVRGFWQHKERPVLINSWEASYFRFTENSLLKLARAAKDVGIELFVLDDGWFGERNDDKKSLGDWKVNAKKLPSGLAGLARKINSLDMQFGLWVEPEMVSEDSDLYRAHPDWAVAVKDREQSLGRNQMILDLTRKEVQDFLISSMEDVFRIGGISYVKWDMNRIFSDVYSPHLSYRNQGEFLHRYLLGLYRIMDTLVRDFPHILFEGCASGGNRFDLGILCYFPQIWASDDTDAIERAVIQRGYSYGYPASVIGAHVSACPNHQTMRSVPLETRFEVAACGAFGYELNLCDMSAKELDAIREQIAFYKQWRAVFQFGDYYRLPYHGAGGPGNYHGTGGPGKSSDLGICRWMTVSKDKTRAAGCMVQTLVQPNTPFMDFRTSGLDEDRIYHISVRASAHQIEDFGSLINAVAPFHVRQDGLVHHAVNHFYKLGAEKEDATLSGSILNGCGLRLSQGFAGTGFNDRTRIFQDFDARMYLFES